jgi:uncharacterized caspase-like protein
MEHDNEEPNFETSVLVSSEESITRAFLNESVEELFSVRDAEIALFYFAGHGHYEHGQGFLVTQDGEPWDWGVAMEQIVGRANRCDARERIIILDCCHAGAIDQIFASGATAGLAEGVSILAACRDNQSSDETDDGGVFTSLLASALRGGAADPVTGHLSIASLYAYADGALGAFAQRPLLKTNINQFRVLRRAAPAINVRIVRRVKDYFAHPRDVLKLDPSFEPDAEPEDAAHEAVFADLQKMRAVNLVEPVDEEHMYYAAMNSTGCRLTALGRYYWLRVTRRQL